MLWLTYQKNLKLYLNYLIKRSFFKWMKLFMISFPKFNFNYFSLLQFWLDFLNVTKNSLKIQCLLVASSKKGEGVRIDLSFRLDNVAFYQLDNFMHFFEKFRIINVDTHSSQHPSFFHALSFSFVTFQLERSVQSNICSPVSCEAEDVTDDVMKYLLVR